MVTVKGIKPESANKLFEYVQLRGRPESVLQTLKEKLVKEYENAEGYTKACGKVIGEMELLFDYLKALKMIDYINFDLSLARGLDYYTGVILEANAIESEGNEVRVGSIAGGGRYDDLIGMFCNRKVPAVGASIGIERIFALIEQKMTAKPKEVDTEVMICSVGENFTKERLEIAGELWKCGIPTEFVYKEKPDVKAQFGQASNCGAVVCVIIAPDEWREGSVKIKILAKNEEVVVRRVELVEKVKEILRESGSNR
jgi:histidyl-tRNA synthetase